MSSDTKEQKEQHQQRCYDSSLKRQALTEVLANYKSFLRLPSIPADKRLVFFLTVCRLLDLAADAESEEEQSCTSTTTTRTTPDKATATAFNPINFEALRSNQDRLFARYAFETRESEKTNFELYFQRLLDPPTDSTAKFL